jgi:hypothetical protein
MNLRGITPFDAVLAKTATTPTRSPKIDESSSLSSKKCLSPMSRDIGRDGTPLGKKLTFEGVDSSKKSVMSNASRQTTVSSANRGRSVSQVMTPSKQNNDNNENNDPSSTRSSRFRSSSTKEVSNTSTPGRKRGESVNTSSTTTDNRNRSTSAVAFGSSTGNSTPSRTRTTSNRTPGKVPLNKSTGQQGTPTNRDRIQQQQSETKKMTIDLTVDDAVPSMQKSKINNSNSNSNSNNNKTSVLNNSYKKLESVAGKRPVRQMDKC